MATLTTPASIFIVRHGESNGNVARRAAISSASQTVGIATRDVDVPLSPTGESQADALGHWFSKLPQPEKPNVVVSSPYLRARQTAQRIMERAELDYLVPDNKLHLDERFREREFGILDGLTKVGIAAHYPEQAELRNKLGKFYHRPPGGESWCDVILRLRSALLMVNDHYAGQRVLIVCHSVVVLCLRYILEGMTEHDILAIDQAHEVANCSVTRYDVNALANSERLELTAFNFTAPLEDRGAPVTTLPDIAVQR